MINESIMGISGVKSFYDNVDDLVSEESFKFGQYGVLLHRH